jgi:hypothetical protein
MESNTVDVWVRSNEEDWCAKEWIVSVSKGTLVHRLAQDLGSDTVSSRRGIIPVGPEGMEIEPNEVYIISGLDAKKIEEYRMNQCSLVEYGF